MVPSCQSAAFSEIVVRHVTMKKQVEGLLALYGVDLPVSVKPGWYF
jgi:hypothetical protein